MRFSFNYLSLFTFLLITEVLIALYVHDSFIRPYIGDTLVVVMIYAFVMGVLALVHNFKTKVIVASFVLLFSCIVEGLQAASFIYKVGLADVWWARLIFGTSFSWWDMVAYLGGYVSILLVEWYYIKSASLKA